LKFELVLYRTAPFPLEAPSGEVRPHKRGDLENMKKGRLSASGQHGVHILFFILDRLQGKNGVRPRGARNRVGKRTGSDYGGNRGYKPGIGPNTALAGMRGIRRKTTKEGAIDTATKSGIDASIFRLETLCRDILASTERSEETTERGA